MAARDAILDAEHRQWSSFIQRNEVVGTYIEMVTAARFARAVSPRPSPPDTSWAAVPAREAGEP
ncbi:MAG: hypothetical protein NVS2B15_25340 [Pseudarthrobacter sp.]